MSFLGLVPIGPDPCPVCGAEGGNCGPEGDHPGAVRFKEWAADYRPPKEGMEMGDVVARDRVWERVPIPRSKRFRRVLRYRAGQVIPEEKARALNVGDDGIQTEVPTSDRDESPSVPLDQGPPRENQQTGPPEVQGDPVKTETPDGPPIETPPGPSDLETS